MGLLTCMLFAVAAWSAASEPPPTLPKQFTATVTVTAHRVDRSKEYPPRLRVINVKYDQPHGRFLAEYDHTHRTVVRRYDQGKEFLVTRVDGKAECRASKLKDVLPPPEWPSTVRPVIISQATFIGKEQLGKVQCNHWRDEQGSVVVDIFVDAGSGALVRVQVETVEKTEPVRMTQPDITYDIANFVPGQPAEGGFVLPPDVTGGEDSCERQPNDIGFPYVHFFHHYYRA